MKSIAPFLLFLIALSAAAAPPPKPPSPPPDVAAPPADAQRSPTGLYTKVLKPGSGTRIPTDDDYVRIRYTIFSSDGSLLDWIAPPQSAIVAVKLLNRGMHEALLQMQPGETMRVWMNERLGPPGKVPAKGYAVADLDLLEVIETPTVPSDVREIPPNAKVTKSGLAYRVLREGHGTRHPKASDRVVVNYSGWTTTGHMFDTSILRGEPAEFPLDEVIAGWREGIQLMTEGEKIRLWIPEKLAYKGEKGKVPGMLVFDVELVKIK